jgi:tyrosinase
MVGKREDAWKLGAGWNDTFLWYAKAIIVLKNRDVTDRTSWRYLAAMHQFDRELWISLGIIQQTTALPPATDSDIAWNQCQHSSFYFLPWHRGYLARFEEIIAATIVALGGPADWKLPYWNYLDAANPNARKTIFPISMERSSLPRRSANGRSILVSRHRTSWSSQTRARTGSPTPRCRMLLIG